MKNKVITVLTEIRPEFDFTEDVNYIEQGMLDSFDMISLVVALDEKFNISIDGINIVPENFNTLSAIVSLLSKYGVQE